tara:strand:+ start:19909 stop:20052 length:144 start_codon:yes stop_codon:yes gene_type:complete
MTNSKKTAKSSLLRMGKFTTSKLIQNLGSNKEQFRFVGPFRGVHGRD